LYRTMLRCKIHRATITEANLEYEGSLTVDEDLMDAAGIRAFEQVTITNLNNGERIETYVIPGPRGSGVMCLNGPAARKGIAGDKVVVFCYELYTDDELKNYKPAIIKVDAKNQIVKS